MHVKDKLGALGPGGWESGVASIGALEPEPINPPTHSRDRCWAAYSSEGVEVAGASPSA